MSKLFPLSTTAGGGGGGGDEGLAPFCKFNLFTRLTAELNNTK